MQPQVYSYIRFSSPKQEQGASYDRQKEATERWAKLHDVALASDVFYDRAKSAWDGSNIRDGRLGAFLKLVQEGEVAPGSTLVVENLDRISRDDIFVALETLKAIVYSGIRIVTLSDGMEYTEEKLKKEKMVIFTIVGTFLRGQQESDMKSERVRDALARKRRNLDVRKWDTSFPSWLRLNKEKTDFSIIEPKANVIRRIFSDYDNGKSTHTIAAELTAEGIERPYSKKTKHPKTLWHVSTVMDYLLSRSVIGEYQPRERAKGDTNRKVDVGLPRENYYPEIVPRDVFLRVTAKIAVKKKVRGRRCEGLVNLFRGLLRCPYCGGTLMLNRQKLFRKGVLYGSSDAYICDHAHHFDRSCLRYGWDRVDFEQCFLEFAEEVHAEYSKVSRRQSQSNADEIARYKNELADIAKRQKRLLPAFESELIELPELEARSRELKERKALLEAQLLTASTLQTPEQVAFDLEKFINIDLADPTRREQLADVISRTFDHIDVFFVGLPSRYRMLKTAQKRYLMQGHMKPNQIFFRLSKLLPFKRERFFVAYLKDGRKSPWPVSLFSDPEFVDLYGRRAEQEFRSLGVI